MTQTTPEPAASAQSSTSEAAPTLSEPTFADIASFVRAPRLSGLAASRSGPVVASLSSTDEDGAAFVGQLVALETPHPHSAQSPSSMTTRLLTRGVEGAGVLAVGERGEVYFQRKDAQAEKKGAALWMLPPRGEARELVRHRGGIEALAVTKAGLVLTLGMMPGADTPAASSELAKMREDAKVTAVLHDRYPSRYWDEDLGPSVSAVFNAPLPELDSMDAEPLELSPVRLPAAPGSLAQWDLSALMASEDGTFALVQFEGRSAIDTHLQVWKIDLGKEAGEPVLIAAEDEIEWELGAIDPGGRWAILDRGLPPRAGQTMEYRLWRVDLDNGEKTLISGDYDGMPGGVVIGDDGQVYFAAERAGRGGIYRLDADGSAALITPDDESAYSALTWSEGRIWALRSSVAEAATVVAIDPQSGAISEARRLTPDLELPGELTEIEASALDGTALRAWLALPEGEGPHPLIVFAHGGPWGSWNDWTWRWNPWVFVARGYAVLMPDPGISVGYGQAMTARGHDAIGDEPFTDIMALTDAAVARPDIDADRQGFAGGSYGGYMANWVAGHTGTRFKGIVTHAGLWNIASMGLTTDNGEWYRWMTGIVEAVGDSQAERWSPHDYADEIQVPMLVIHGDRDYRVPFSQALELWSDLQRLSPELGHRFLYFPNEGHWILGPGNAEVWYQTFLGFMDEHVLGKERKDAELLGH